jgi:hypothetical protein
MTFLPPGQSVLSNPETASHAVGAQVPALDLAVDQRAREAGLVGGLAWRQILGHLGIPTRSHAQHSPFAYTISR